MYRSLFNCLCRSYPFVFVSIKKLSEWINVSNLTRACFSLQQNNTALHYAASSGLRRCVEVRWSLGGKTPKKWRLLSQFLVWDEHWKYNVNVQQQCSFKRVVCASTENTCTVNVTLQLLVLRDAPLFSENAQKHTPCDCAEKSGNNNIALYLESKMVFSVSFIHHSHTDGNKKTQIKRYFHFEQNIKRVFNVLKSSLDTWIMNKQMDKM